MNLKSILDQLIVAGGAATKTGQTRNLGDLASGAAVGGVMGLLLGSKSGRKFVSTAATYGGLAVVGGLAFKAFKNWQASSPGNAQQVAVDRRANGSATVEPKTIDYLNLPAEFQAEGQSGKLEFAIVSAMISVTKADGKIDSAEQAKIFEALQSTSLSPEQKSEIFSKFDTPATVKELAGMVDSLEHRSEIYLASCLAADGQHPRVVEHLDALRQAMQLPAELAHHLKQQANQS